MLHIVNNLSSLNACLHLAQAEDVILLIDDGVKAVTSIDAKQYSVYALKTELETHQLLEKVTTDIKVIDYEGFVDLALKHYPIQTWG